jgi:hypothetical protein
MAYYNIGEGFSWFMGRVVELDPTEDPKHKRYLGRVKVRVLHEQTGELGKIKKTYGITDDDLLWAWPLSSIQSASLSYRKIVELEEYQTPFWIDAVGTSPTGIAVGTYVFGFYLDGQEANIPVIFSTYHKNSMYPEPPTDEATGEMLQIRPPEGPIYDYMDISALAKGWHEDLQRELNHPLGQEYPIATEPGVGGQMLPKHKSSANPDGYKKGLMNLVWEPASDYDTEYPYNLVHTTKSGHAIEIDDTPGHERMHLWHRSGSYEEISDNVDGSTPYRDGLSGEYPNTMLGWKEPQKHHVAGQHPPWKGRRVKKTVGNDYHIILENRERYVGASQKLEIANNTTTGIGNNVIETVANNMYVAVGYYPRQANNELSGESARYQLEDSWQDQTGYRDKSDKLIFKLPEPHKYDYITDVANNVQLSVGWSWKKARELDPISEKNHWSEIANNQVTTIGWIPLNNYDKDKEARGLNPIEKTNHYIDIKNNSFTTLGWKPFDEARTQAEIDVANKYTDVKNNSFLNIGYEPQGEDARLITDEDVYNRYVDVRNTTEHSTQNNFYLNVGNKPKDGRAKDKSKERSLFIDVSNEWATRVGKDMALDVRGNMTFNVVGNTLLDLHRQATINSRNELIVNSEMGVTIEAPSVTILGPLYVRDGIGTKTALKKGSIVDVNGDIFTIVNGVIVSGP